MNSKQTTTIPIIMYRMLNIETTVNGNEMTQSLRGFLNTFFCSHSFAYFKLQ